MQGSLETRFLQSTSDYADVLQTGVIEKAKVAAVQSGLRQLIDDTTECVLLLKDENSVLCWLTGIPSSRKDYTGTKIRYAIALRDDAPEKMREWAGILCGLYSNPEQMESLGKFLDGFVEEDNRSVKPSLKFEEIADFLKSKITPVQTEGIDDDCEFVLASYLAESKDPISKAISKGVRPPHAGGAFWNGSGFSEVSHNSKKKRSSTLLPKPVNQQAEQANSSGTESKKLSRCTSSGINKIIVGATAALILLVGIGVKLNDVRLDQKGEIKSKNNTITELKGTIESKNKEIDNLNGTIQSKDKEITGLKTKVKNLEEQLKKSGKKLSPTPSAETGNPKDPKPDQKNGNQSPKKDRADKK